MKRSCTIIISHFESVAFLKACIRQIRKHKNENISHYILVADQSSDTTHNKIIEKYWGAPDIRVVKMRALWSGYGIDYIMRSVEIKTEYICQLHTDAFPIHKNWLLLPIKLIEENNFAFVGQLHFISDGTSPIYPPGKPFFSMSPTFNVARTETYKEMAMEGGFTRFHNRNTDNHNKIEMDMPMTWGNSDWYKWAKEDYYNRGSDDDTVAFCWEDTYREHDKLGLDITGTIADIGREPDFGRVIEDIVFHFGSCRESMTIMEKMGDNYNKYTKKINEGYTDILVDEILNLVKPTHSCKRELWDGKLKISSPPPDAINKRIEELKNYSV